MFNLIQIKQKTQDIHLNPVFRMCCLLNTSYINISCTVPTNGETITIAHWLPL